MRNIICVLLLLLVLLGPLPPLLPSRPGPATRAGARTRCSAVISPSAWPARCGSWQLGGAR